MAKTLTLHRWIDQENLTLDVELVAENPNMIGTSLRRRFSRCLALLRAACRRGAAPMAA